MTALSGSILFNNTDPSASDTAASGCGAASAISVMLMFSSGSYTASASWSGTINQGDLIYVPANTLGRKYNVVASVGSGMLTFDYAWGDSQFGTAGYVGGKRAGNDLSTDAIFTEAPDGAVIEIEYTGTDYDNTASFQPALGSLTGGAVTIKGTGSDKPRIGSPTSNSNCMRFGGGYMVFENIQFVGKKTSGGGIDVVVRNSSQSVANFKNCVFKSEQSQVGGSLFSDSQNGRHVGFLDNCIFDGNGLSSAGYFRSGGTYIYQPFVISNCIFKNINPSAASVAIYLADSVSSLITNCIIHDCGAGIDFLTDAFEQHTVENNIFHNLSGNGIRFQNDETMIATKVRYNVFSNVTGDALTSIAAYPTEAMSDIDFNAFYSVTGNNYTNITSGANDILLSADPFVDAAAKDFNISDSSGGGSSLRSATLPSTGTTDIYPFRQWVTDSFGSGGGGSNVFVIEE